MRVVPVVDRLTSEIPGEIPGTQYLSCATSPAALGNVSYVLCPRNPVPGTREVGTLVD